MSCTRLRAQHRAGRRCWRRRCRARPRSRSTRCSRCSRSSEKSVKMPQVALLPKTPLRMVTFGLWSTRTAARLALKDAQAVDHDVGREGDEDGVAVVGPVRGDGTTRAPVPCALMVMGAPRRAVEVVDVEAQVAPVGDEDGVARPPPGSGRAGSGGRAGPGCRRWRRCPWARRSSRPRRRARRRWPATVRSRAEMSVRRMRPSLVGGSIVARERRRTTGFEDVM